MTVLVVAHVLEGVGVVVGAPVGSLTEEVELASGEGFTRSRMVCMATPPHLATPDQPWMNPRGSSHSRLSHFLPNRTQGATPVAAGTEPAQGATSTTSSPRVSPNRRPVGLPGHLAVWATFYGLMTGSAPSGMTCGCVALRRPIVSQCSPKSARKSLDTPPNFREGHLRISR